MLAYQAALLVDQGLVAAVGAFQAFGFRAVGDVFFQGTGHTDLPCIDVFTFELQAVNEFDDVFQRHAVAQHTRNQFGIVPIFLVEFLRKTFHGGLVSAFVFKLEVVALRAVFSVDMLDDAAFGDRFRQDDALFVVLQSGEDLIGSSVEQSDESHPFLLVVLEAHHVAFKHFWAAFHNGRERLQFGALVFLLFLHADHDAGA